VSSRLTDLEETLDAGLRHRNKALASVGEHLSDWMNKSINEFLESVKSHDLAKAEILNIINIRPTNIVKIFP
ncbi:hypothetical protein S83_035209, partial [Arachis hypogaea]